MTSRPAGPTGNGGPRGVWWRHAARPVAAACGPMSRMPAWHNVRRGGTVRGVVRRGRRVGCCARSPRAEAGEDGVREPAASCRSSLGGPPPARSQPGPPGLTLTQKAPGGSRGGWCTRTCGIVPQFAWRASARTQSTRPSGPDAHTKSPRRKPGDSGSHSFPGAMRCGFAREQCVPSWLQRPPRETAALARFSRGAAGGLAGVSRATSADMGHWGRLRNLHRQHSFTVLPPLASLQADF